MSYAAMGYCLLGYYLKKYPLRRRWGALSLGLGLACVFGGHGALLPPGRRPEHQVLGGHERGRLPDGRRGFSPCWPLSRGTGPRLGAAARFLSKASFCVYLSHMLFLHVLRALGAGRQLAPAGGRGVPLLALLTVLGGLVVYVAASRVPVGDSAG